MPYNIGQHQANIFQAYMNRKFPEIWINVSYYPLTARPLIIDGENNTDPERLVISFMIPPEADPHVPKWKGALLMATKRFKDSYDARTKCWKYKRYWFTKWGRLVLQSETIVDSTGRHDPVVYPYDKPEDGGPWRQMSLPVQEYRVVHVEHDKVNLTFTRGRDGKKRRCRMT